ADAHSGIRALWAPARVSESAETMAAVMRPNLALRRQRDARARKAMRTLEVAWDKMPQAAQLAFAMAVDEGRVGDLPASQQALAKLLADITEGKRREANALGGKVGFIEHYYPREWVKPGKVRDYIMRAVYGPPTIQVKEAYDAGLMEALHRFATEQGIRTVRRVNLGGTRWGYHVRKGDRSEVHTRFGGPEGVLMHEIGHVLDHTHQLGEKIGLAQASERREEINFNEVPSKVAKELRALADLRTDTKSTKHFRQYVRSRPEVIANLVHAFLYAPYLAKQTAPNQYWALHSLAKDTPALRGPLDIQQARSLRFGVNVAAVRVDGRVVKGYYYGPPDAVRLLENHLSPGLRGNVAFDLYRQAGNFLNQVQLGLSVFHVLTTATNSTISKGALALEQASRGQVGAALKSAALTATLIGPPIRDIINGHRYLKSFYERDANFRERVHEADILATGGGGGGWDGLGHESRPDGFLRAVPR